MTNARVWLCFVLSGILTAAFGVRLAADQEGTPRSHITTSNSGTALFEMLAPGWTKEGPGPSSESHGIAYSMSSDGSLNKVWSVRGWYAGRVYISDDAHFMVRMGPWCRGAKPAPEDLAVAFYRDGRLLKQYATTDLLKDPSRVIVSVSHYFWLADGIIGRRNSDFQLRLEDYDKSFSLTTIDGWAYTFDIETGAIRTARKVDAPTGAWASPADIDRLSIALLLVDFPSEYSELVRQLGLRRVEHLGVSYSGAIYTELWAVTDPASSSGFVAVELTVRDYDYKGGPNGYGSGQVTTARLLHVSGEGLYYAFVPSRELEKLCQKQRTLLRPANQTAAQCAEQLLKRMNGRAVILAN